MVQTKQPAGVLDPELDGFHESVLWDVEVSVELGGQREQSERTPNQSGHPRFTNVSEQKS